MQDVPVKRVVAFLGSALGVWLPFITWVAIRVYVFDHEDPKLGKDQAIVLFAMIWGVLALLSAFGGQMAYAFKKRELDSISISAIFSLHFLSGLFLSAISFPFLYKWILKFVGITHPLVFATWLAISVAVTYLGIQIYTHLFRQNKY
jgi:glucan phosphoethanolaminetransferase (alkaline phosphatase superfamily)